jgi:hypothetical protein
MPKVMSTGSRASAFELTSGNADKSAPVKPRSDFEGGNSEMKSLKYLAVLSTLALLSPLCALARDKNQHSVDVPDAVQIGSTRLDPGSYKVEWQGAGPLVQVSFLQHGKTVATAPGNLKMNDNEVSEDALVLDKTKTNTKTLKEIDFGRQKEALVFGQTGM